jgi:pimeloyl-ACP methyl ester carboxylesterase
LLRSSWFGEEERGFLSEECRGEDEAKAAEWVVRCLEGGELVVPTDWQERVAKGEVVAQAVKEWQMREHKGHVGSVVGIFRDGGVMDNDELFVQAKKTGLPALVVLGEDDGLSTEEEVRGFGFEVRVVEKAGHGVVREQAGEVAGFIGEFWRRNIGS